MYSMYAERNHWKIEILNENETELGGYKEITFMITGKGAYSRLKFESGVHRVQRVPDTESSGRIHTSTSTVAVLPVVEDVEIEINPADVRMEVFRASGAGGQHVNKTSSAVRLIHEPTGIVAECQTERSQLQNREYAMRLLKSRLYEQEKRSTTMTTIINIFSNLKRYQFLMRQLILRDFKKKYKRSVLGVVWSLLYPILMMTVMAIVFSQMFRFKVEGINYLVYLMTGIIMWQISYLLFQYLLSCT